MVIAVVMLPVAHGGAGEGVEWGAAVLRALMKTREPVLATNVETSAIEPGTVKVGLTLSSKVREVTISRCICLRLHCCRGSSVASQSRSRG